MATHSSETDRPDAVAIEPVVPPLRRYPTPLARRFYQICISMVADSVAEAGLTPLQYGVLPCLNKLAGEPGIDQTELAGRLGVDRTNAGMLIDQLEGKELVERRVSGADRRARLLYLTSKGEKLYEQLRPVNLAANERILAPLAPKERELLLSLLVRVIEGNRLHARPGAGRRKWGSGKSDAKG